MAEVIVDSNVWVAYFVRGDAQNLRAQRFLEEFENRVHHCHLPRLVFVEVCASVGRRTTPARAMRVRAIFSEWSLLSRIAWYDLDQTRMQQAVTMALDHGLRGADAVIVALGDELRFPVLTFDNDILSRYPNAQRP